jgi:hypothetical protein
VRSGAPGHVGDAALQTGSARPDAAPSSHWQWGLRLAAACCELWQPRAPWWAPGRGIHQSGMRIAPLAHSALPDAEANVIGNLLEPCAGAAQHLKDREILEFLGDNPGITS